MPDATTTTPWPNRPDTLRPATVPGFLWALVLSPEHTTVACASVLVLAAKCNNPVLVATLWLRSAKSKKGLTQIDSIKPLCKLKK